MRVVDNVWMLALCAVVVLLAGCGGSNTPAPTTAEATFTITPSVSGETASITMPNGSVGTIDDVKAMAASSAKLHSAISFVVAPEENPGVKPADFTVGKYWCDIRWEWGYVGSCIRRNCWHLNLHIRDKSSNQDVFNAHLCGWWQNGPQFGIYNPPSNYCATTRGNFTSIKNAIQDALSRSVPWIPYAVAVSIAYVSAGVVVGAFAF
jgi:hypothetical protein